MLREHILHEASLMAKAGWKREHLLKVFLEEFGANVEGMIWGYLYYSRPNVGNEWAMPPRPPQKVHHLGVHLRPKLYVIW